MPWVDVVRAVLRRWWVFVTIFALLAAGSVSIRDVGSEFIALSKVTVVGPTSENPLLDSSKPIYIATAIIAVYELYDDSYHAELVADGLSDDFEIDFYSTFPVMTIETKASTYSGVRESAERISEDFADRIDQVQADRDVPELARLHAEVLEVTQPGPRPAGSNRALAGLLLASGMIAGACAYGVDQFLLPALRDRRRQSRSAARERRLRMGTS